MTYIYKSLTINEIANRLRQDDNANWSYEGSIAMAEWLEKYVNDTGEPMELDVVAIRCDFNEYADYEDIFNEYSNLFDTVEDCKKNLKDHTLVIEFKGGIIIQTF